MYMQHRHFWWDYVVRVRDGEERRWRGWSRDKLIDTRREEGRVGRNGEVLGSAVTNKDLAVSMTTSMESRVSLRQICCGRRILKPKFWRHLLADFGNFKDFCSKHTKI